MTTARIELKRQTADGGIGGCRHRRRRPRRRHRRRCFRRWRRAVIVPPTEEERRRRILRSSLYVGEATGENGRAYGLVNVALFLAMSASDSIIAGGGGCDEASVDAIERMTAGPVGSTDWNLSFKRLGC
jgi:hypothetical protein